MTKNREQIMEDMLQLLRQLAEDWEYTGEISADTRFFTDLKLASLDVVVLGTSIQEFYGQVFPFPDFYTEVGKREVQDVSVGEWVDFIAAHLKESSVPGVGPTA